MKATIDAPAGRAQYVQRFATVEPVFANVRHNKRLDRFTPPPGRGSGWIGRLGQNSQNGSLHADSSQELQEAQK